MALTQEEILVGIDRMPIYQKDYDIIRDLIKTVEPPLFTKIVEEVLTGGLYWSDFDRFLGNTDYEELLRDNLEVQGELKKKLKMLSDFRKQLYNDDFTMLDNNKSLAVITPGSQTYNYEKVASTAAFDPNEVYYTKNDKSDYSEAHNISAFEEGTVYYTRSISRFYEDELARIRDDLLYEMTKIEPTDSALTVAFKIKLENAIRNGEYVVKNLESLEQAGRLTSTGQVLSEDKQKAYDYINPNDIFLNIGSYLIPLDINHQTLTRADRLFMDENGLNEKDMKAYKAISLLLRRDMSVNGGA